MSSQTSKKQETPAIMPRQTMKGHTDHVYSVVHLPDGRRIITCSGDGSLRLWDLEGSAQIGEDWRDGEEKKVGVWSIALSPNGKTVVSGGHDGKVKLWDVETGKVVAKWTGHTESVRSVCWSADGNRVGSGSGDETARVWNVKTGETIMKIKTGHEWVWAVIYSPDNTQIATGGYDESAAKIWDAKTGKLIFTLKHSDIVESLAWTSDGEKLISGSLGPIRIFDTATWQEIAIVEGHELDYVRAISLSRNNRLLASASGDKTARLWNLDTNLPVGPPLQHENALQCAAFSADGKMLVTGCENNNVYVWDIHDILKKAGLEDLLSIPHVPARKSLKDSGASRRPPIEARRISPGFFDGVQPSAARGTHTLSPAHNPRSAQQYFSANPRLLLDRLSSFFHQSRSNADEATELQQRPRRSILSRGPRIVEVAAVQDRKALYVAPPPRPQQQNQSHVQGSSSQSQPTTTSTSTTPAQGTSAATAGVTAQSPPIPLLARVVLFLCCASPPHANGH